VEVFILYMAAWLAGNGCVPIHNLMEDAATAEISRTQLWQWAHRKDTRLDDGSPLDKKRIDTVLDEQSARLIQAAAPAQQAHVRRAAELVRSLTHAERLEPFLTTVAYNDLE
jgi:malate synthase